MQLYPAIDIKNGQCVRLRQGKFQDVRVYSQTPLKIAKQWESLGATYLHLVDLDGALAGHSVNYEIIKEIAGEVSVPIQVGGGVRTISDIEAILNLGVTRVIIGTKAVESPAFIKEAINKFGSDRIVVGIDGKDGMVAIEGWEKVSNYNVVTLGLHMKEMGVKTIIYTDISKDGMLKGPNIEYTRIMADSTGLDIIASGGISMLKDLERLGSIHVQGAIIGKALYEKRFSLEEAITLFEKGEKL